MIDWNQDINSDNINEIYNRLGETPIRLLTFQCKNVVDTLIKDKIYRGIASKAREKRDYHLDIDQLDGDYPIWCFTPIIMHTGPNLHFTKEDFIDGTLFNRFRCEMSTDRERLNTKYLLELEVPSNTVKLGLTHNSFLGASIIPKIEYSNLVGIYKLQYPDDDDPKWYYPEINIIQIFHNNALFIENFYCRKIKKLQP